jgi:hypothetical protein
MKKKGKSCAEKNMKHERREKRMFDELEKMHKNIKPERKKRK